MVQGSKSQGASPDYIYRDDGSASAVFAGGCFWCMVKPFHKYDGVLEVISGYTGGNSANPSYQEVCAGNSGHLEAVEVIYDPKTISYEDLLQVFWQAIDPTDSGGQFNDRGPQYQPAIFYTSEEQAALAKKSKQQLEASGRFHQIAVDIRPAVAFYPAEEEHQDYYKKNPGHYELYYAGSGRKSFIESAWSDQKEHSK